MKIIVIICSMLLMFTVLTACSIFKKNDSGVAAGGIVGGVAPGKAQ